MAKDTWDPGVDHYATVELRGDQVERWTCSCGRQGRTKRSLNAHFERTGKDLRHPHHHRLVGDKTEGVI